MHPIKTVLFQCPLYATHNSLFLCVFGKQVEVGSLVCTEDLCGFAGIVLMHLEILFTELYFLSHCHLTPYAKPQKQCYAFIDFVLPTNQSRSSNIIYWSREDQKDAGHLFWGTG